MRIGTICYTYKADMSGNTVALPWIKLSLGGNISVGKTSIQTRYLIDEFEKTYQTTIGLDIQKKTVVVKDRNVRVDIWDSAGQERYESMTRQCFREAHGIVIVFDLTDWASFSDVNKRWLPKIIDECPKALRMLIGNKSDLTKSIPDVDIKLFAEKNEFSYFEVSAKTGDNIQHAFDIFLSAIVDKFQLFEKKMEDKKVVKLGGTQAISPVPERREDQPLFPRRPPPPQPESSCEC